MKPKIYLAGPLFNEAELSFNKTLCLCLEQIGYEVFLPQRDGVERSKPPYNKYSKNDRRTAMFNMDRDKILECDIFLFILDGRVPDEGAAIELGIAYCQIYLQRNKHKKLIGLQTDTRAAFIQSKLNPMIKVPLDIIFESSKDLLHYFKNHHNSLS